MNDGEPREFVWKSAMEIVEAFGAEVAKKIFPFGIPLPQIAKILNEEGAYSITHCGFTLKFGCKCQGVYFAGFLIGSSPLYAEGARFAVKTIMDLDIPTEEPWIEPR